jgi:pSer/pThr/pTyr-binding forkhead associated (FHA) protein
MMTCPKCGELLFDPIESTTIYHQDPMMLKLRRAKPALGGSQIAERLVLLHIRGVIERLLFEDGTEVVLGRAKTGDSIVDRFDLTKYGAHERGVSRGHALLRYNNNQLTVTDMGSMNGTFVNGKRLPTNDTQLVRHNDEVALGRLSFRVQFETPKGTDKLRAHRVQKTLALPDLRRKESTESAANTPQPPAAEPPAPPATNSPAPSQPQSEDDRRDPALRKDR